MDADHQVTLIPDQHITMVAQVSRYGDDLARAGQAAENALPHNVFTRYHATTRPHTKLRQLNDLAHFSTYLAAAGVTRKAEDLYHDPEAWRGMHYATLSGYVAWALEQGYTIGTINVRLATIHKFCVLAGPAPDGVGIIDQETLIAILAVKGIGKTARNVDQDRERRNIPQRKGHKKAAPTTITTHQALQLKKLTTEKYLEERDALLMGLLIEHALRCNEVASLDIECFDLARGTFTVYREKTNQTDTQIMKKHTMIAAERYLTTLKAQGRTQGPLFLGYKGQRMSTRAINARVGVLGESLKIEHLSPHDLRHHWTHDALRNGTSVDRVQAGGGWKSPEMVLRYARRQGISNEGVNITEE